LLVAGCFACPAIWLLRYPDIPCRDLTFSPVAGFLCMIARLHDRMIA
jgi:hypothetical protein